MEKTPNHLHLLNNNTDSKLCQVYNPATIVQAPLSRILSFARTWGKGSDRASTTSQVSYGQDTEPGRVPARVYQGASQAYEGGSSQTIGDPLGGEV